MKLIGIYIFTILFMSAFIVKADSSKSSQSDDLSFLKIYNQRKEKLKKLTPKIIPKTPYCENRSALLDQSPRLNMKTTELKADRIVISKSRKKMYLISNGLILNEYNVAFGFGFLDGAKSQMGDGRTPEGIYEIDFKNFKSKYHKSLLVSYPNKYDSEFARENKVHSGDNIMIHGLPSLEVDFLKPLIVANIHPQVNWTQGCIAVTDSEIDEIFKLVAVQTTVEICPLD